MSALRCISSALITSRTPETRATAEPYLQRALWENIVDLRLSEEKHRKQLRALTIALACLAIVCAVLFFLTT